MTNPLLDDINNTGVLPPINLGLPTNGAFYNPGEIIEAGADISDLSIRAISVLEESTFNDPMMLVTGKAVSNMVRRVCPEILNPGGMAEFDIQAILIASRIASYGPELTMDVSCTKCKTEMKAQINLIDHIAKFSPLTAEELEQFDLELPAINQSIRLRPIIYQDSVDIGMSALRTQKATNQFEGQTVDELDSDFINVYIRTFEDAMTANIDAMLGSIQAAYTSTGAAVTDRESIKTWLKSLPLTTVKLISNRMAEINKGLMDRSMLNYVCQNGECGHESQMYLELDPQRLFTVAEESTVEKSSSAKSKSTKRSAKARSKTSRR